MRDNVRTRLTGQSVRHDNTVSKKPRCRSYMTYVVISDITGLILLNVMEFFIQSGSISSILFIAFDDCNNILISFGRECPPIPSLGSRILTFHLVFSASLSSGTFMLFVWQ